MKIAYLVLVHQNPRLLKRVVDRLSSDVDCAFFIHVDRKSNLQAFSEVRGPNVHWSEQRLPVYWGEYSQVAASMLLIRSALDFDPSFRYFILLHGSDYPLRSGRYIEEFLKRHDGAEFLSLVQMPAEGYPLSKIQRLRYPSDRPIRRFVSRVLAKAGLASRNHTKYLAGMVPYAGDAWWTLSRDACQYIVDYIDNHPRVETFFQNAFTSDEMLFHTILGNSPFRARCQRSLLYTDWPKGSNHPVAFSEKHMNLFALQDRVWIQDEWGSGEALFARKFSDDNLGLIDQIDQMILRKDRDPPQPERIVTARFSNL